MERLQKVLADVDEATPPQLEALQRADKNARRQMSSVRVDSGTVRDFLPEQSKSNQRERFGREPRIAEERFRDEQKLRSAEDRIKKTATDQHKAVEQRLLATEQESVTTEQNLRRIDEWRQNVEDRLRATEHLQGTLQRLHDLQQQLTDAVSQIKTLEPKIKSCEDRLQSNTGLTIETKKTFDAQTGRLENLEISIGELVKQLQHLKADLSNIDGAKLKSFQSRLTSTRRMQGFAMIACIISLLLVTYVGMGNRGLSFVAQYISQWVPGLLI
jgi:chromosome segregation ATPase